MSFPKTTLAISLSVLSMKMINYLSAKFSLFLLCIWLTISCKKDNTGPEYCSDGTCCTPTSEKFKVAGRLEGDEAILTGIPPRFASSTLTLKTRFPKGATCQSSVASVCELSIDKIQNVKVSQNEINPEYKYKVWGTVYYKLVEHFTCQPILMISIDRIEEIK